MHFGMGQLRLSSREFWIMSLPEIRVLTQHGRGGRKAPSRDDLAALIRAFPDAETGW